MTDHTDVEAPVFASEYSSNLPAVLKHLNISLAFTSYQAQSLMLVRTDGDSLDINVKQFARPMGLATDASGFTLGVFTQAIRFQREDGLLAQIHQPLPRIEDDPTAPRLDRAQDGSDQHTDERLLAAVDPRVDACFISRSSHYTGMINIHDIDWGDGGLWAVNSSFSCLCTLSPNYSFVPRWKPPFISDLQPEDRCHLNGMTLRDGKPAYVTTFSTADQARQWRTGDHGCGTLIDVARNEIVVDGLSMPHSPRWYRGRVYYCNSGLGQLCCYDPTTGVNQVLAELPGFTRGMDFYGPLLIVGLSTIRASAASQASPLAERCPETLCGLWILNLDDLSEVGHIRFTGDVAQIYDVAVLTGCCFPEVLEPDHPRLRNHFCFPPLTGRESVYGQ